MTLSFADFDNKFDSRKSTNLNFEIKRSALQNRIKYKDLQEKPQTFKMMRLLAITPLNSHIG